MPITGYQLAAAQALIGLDRVALAKRANVSADAISAMEAAKTSPVAGADAEAVQTALEACGVEFSNHGRPGVRMRHDADGSGSIPVEDLTSANDE